MKLPLSVRIFSLYAITIGTAVLITNYISDQAAVPLIAAASQQVIQQTPANSEQQNSAEAIPKYLTIDALELSLNVNMGTYNDDTQEWTLDNENAFYASVSRKLNTENGTTVIYGHDRASVFGPLENIKVGDEAKVLSDDGRQFTYVYRSDKAISPESVNVLYEQSPTPQLVLLTCDGVWSDVRRIMYFDLVGASDV
ncbi:MAG: sortase [Patescibacteria group bacterium]